MDELIKANDNKEIDMGLVNYLVRKPKPIPADLKAIEASDILYDYLFKIPEAKKKAHWPKFMFVYLQLNRVEQESYRAKELVNEQYRDMAIEAARKRALEVKIMDLETQLLETQQELKKKELLIEELTEGMIARCDLCGSET